MPLPNNTRTAAPLLRQKPERAYCPGERGKKCNLPAGHGTTHPGYGKCSKHHGNSPREHKQAVLQEARSRQVLFGQELPIDPFDALRAELGRTNGMIAWAKSMCDLLISTNPSENPADLIKDYRFLAYKELLDEERDRLVRIARASLDSNLAERRQILSEALAEIVVDSFHAMIRAIPDLSPAQIDAAREVITLELTERAGEMVYAKP